MDDVVTGFERERVERGAGDVASCAANASLAAEDLVVRENAQPRHHESTIEHADCQCRRRRRPVVAAQQLVESCGLSFVVAEDVRRRPIAAATVERLAGAAFSRPFSFVTFPNLLSTTANSHERR